MNALLNAKCWRAALIAAAGCFLVFVPNAFAQETPASGVTEAQRVIVTGSNIPTAQEVGPNPVDTYRPADIEKLGIRNATDLMTRLPQEMGSSFNQNIASGGVGAGDGSVIPNLRGYWTGCFEEVAEAKTRHICAF